MTVMVYTQGFDARSWSLGMASDYRDMKVVVCRVYTRQLRRVTRRRPSQSRTCLVMGGEEVG